VRINQDPTRLWGLTTTVKSSVRPTNQTGQQDQDESDPSPRPVVHARVFELGGREGLRSLNVGHLGDLEMLFILMFFDLGLNIVQASVGGLSHLKSESVMFVVVNGHVGPTRRMKSDGGNENKEVSSIYVQVPNREPHGVPGAWASAHPLS
jgi:hypothetical protein